MRIIIDRSRWLRGEGTGRSRLLRSTDGKMCCLGQVLKALGRSDEELSDVSAPGCKERTTFDGRICYDTFTPPGVGTSLVEVVGEGQFFRFDHPMQVSKAMQVNDDLSFSDEERQERLVSWLAPLGFELEFVDGPVAQ